MSKEEEQGVDFDLPSKTRRHVHATGCLKGIIFTPYLGEYFLVTTFNRRKMSRKPRF